MKAAPRAIVVPPSAWRRAHSPLLALAAVLLAGTAGAVDQWIGTPTGADYFRENANAAIRDAIAYKGKAAQFEATIQAAREAYFLAPPANRSAAGAEFATRLFEKDIVLAQVLVIDGVNPHSDAVNKLTAALNGGRELDGGIPRPAKGSFMSWVRSMRGELGARGDDQLILFDEAAFAKALRATEPQYTAYRAERDQAEINRWAGQHPTQEEKDRKLPLRASRPLPPSTFMRLKDSPPLFKVELKKSDDAGALMLNCEYGPYLNANGEQDYSSYLFWKSRPPENVQWLMARGVADMTRVQDRALEECPALEEDARKAAKVPQKIFPTEEMRKQAHAEGDAQWKASRPDIFGRPVPAARTAPPANRIAEGSDPDANQKTQAQISQERIARSREQQVAGRACYTEYASNRASDPAGARDRWSACLRAVRATP
ncbi:hypothetical protein [Variovorax sp. dw_308]|nr:hypothetical protein [Variovorax sp. dw_308]